MKSALAVALWACFASSALAQTDHVHWTLTAPGSVAPGGEFTATLKGQIDAGWHVYSFTTPQPGPIPTSLQVDGVENWRVYQPKPVTKFDQNFNNNVELYTGSVAFVIDGQVRKGASGVAPIAAKVRYQTCSDTVCIPPVTREASASIQVAGGAAASVAIPGGYALVRNPGPRRAVSSGLQNAAPEAPWAFLLTAFGFGLAAIFTPCVFPMIPITVSFFLGQQDQKTSRAQTLGQAALFCGGIIVLFSGLGILATSLLGPFGVVQLGSNPWVNATISLIFVVFGLSLLGAYEITIPSTVLSRLDSASRSGGAVVGTLLMGLTFSLASFACVGPFVGTLLAASVADGGWRPLAGMVAFAAGLALPFFLLAAFPSYLKKLPRSGGWLARVKVVMGFVILAAALKYTAALDQVLRFNVLTRERFLAAWVVLFAMAGLYLLGYVRLEGIQKDEKLSLVRLFVGMILIIFAISLVPGMFGGRLGELEAFVPPPAEGAGGLGAGAATQLVWLQNDFDGALAKARAENKRVLVDFTGYACTNCHWMKQNLFTRPEIAGLMRDLVLVELYTDGEDAASQANQKLEQTDFKTVAIPYYVLYDPAAAGSQPKVLATFPGLTRQSNEFIAFLDHRGEAPAVNSAPAIAAAAALPGVKNLDGSGLDAASLAGKVVVANFWATWCVPCRKEIPEFNKLQAHLGPRGLEVVGISLDEDGADVVKPFLVKTPITYKVGLGSDATKTTYQVGDLLPVTVIFNREGKVVSRFEGLTAPDVIESAVEKVL